MSIEITCRDTDTGETETKTIRHDQYLIVCGADRYVSHEQTYSRGTSLVTIKAQR